MYNRWKRLKAIGKSLNNGTTITAACKAVSIRPQTLWNWRKENPKIEAFIQKALDNQIQIVEDALFKRAVGYQYEEVTKERQESESEKRIAKVVIKEVLPDTTAQIFYLTNRAPDKWKDRRALVQNTVINNPKEGKRKDPFKDIPVPVLKRMVQQVEGKTDDGNGNGRK